MARVSRGSRSRLTQSDERAGAGNIQNESTDHIADQHASKGGYYATGEEYEKHRAQSHCRVGDHRKLVAPTCAFDDLSTKSAEIVNLLRMQRTRPAIKLPKTPVATPGNSLTLD